MSVNVRITYEIALTESEELEGLADSAFTARAHKALIDYLLAARLASTGIVPLPKGYGEGIDAILAYPNQTKITKNN